MISEKIGLKKKSKAICWEVCREFCERKIARGACLSWNTARVPLNIVSHALIAEAVQKNVVYHFDHTKNKRKGTVISCRNLLAICFHKHGFPQNTYSGRKIGHLTKIYRKTLASHMNNKELLRDIHYKPFLKGSPSNYWGKRAVSM